MPTEKPKAKRGRPSGFTEEIAAEICRRMALGESVRKILTEPGMPDWASVWRWLESNEVFRAQYARAREAQAHALVSQIFDIADDDSADWSERDGVPVVNGEAIQRSRLRVDTRKWFASKVLPKLYGDKLSHEVTGQGGAPLVIQVVTGIDRNPGDDAGK
jgi:hypothetical protein